MGQEQHSQGVWVGQLRAARGAEAGGGHWAEHLPCSTSPMVVPEAAVDIVAGAVVCLPTVSTGSETGGRGQTQTKVGEVGKGETKEAEEG